jgi:hypothetical protein
MLIRSLLEIGQLTVSFFSQTVRLMRTSVTESDHHNRSTLGIYIVRYNT